MDMDNIVLIDAAKQLRKLEDETAKPYFAEHKPPHLGVGKNIDVVSAHLKAILEVSNSARNTALHRRSFRCHHEDAERACCCLPGGVGTRYGPGLNLIRLFRQDFQLNILQCR